MSKPLIPDPQHRIDADDFHQAVFKEYGHRCHFSTHKLWRKKKRKFYGSPDTIPRTGAELCSVDATDAMHLVPRSRLGPKSRFALPEINGRPGCRACHTLEEAGLIDFERDDYNKAVRALQKITPRIGLRER